MSILCLDYGNRYIGVAITDYEGKIPLRHSTIDQKAINAIDRIKKIVDEEKIIKIIVGVPVSLAGHETAQTRKSQKFINRLRKVIDNKIDIEGVDETLTSVEAVKSLKLEGAKATEEHMEAARIILETYLRTH